MACHYTRDVIARRLGRGLVHIRRDHLPCKASLSATLTPVLRTALA
jgi:hypothetical protein